ncbi:hypothetical protein amrb99_93260 [Actinomadura sp. RB99]|nr:hypothetical protein [Actinomadura sp. RB99]
MRGLGHPPDDQVPEPLREALGRDRAVQMPGPERRQIPGEGPAAGDALEEHAGRRVHVGGRRGGPPLPLLGRHVGGRPGPGAVPGRGGDPEVDQLAQSVRADDDVGGLVVAVHHAGRVGGGEAAQGPLQHGERRLRLQRAVLGQDPLERDPVHRLHHERGPARRADEPVEPDDVRIVDAAEHHRLGAQPLDGRVVAVPADQVLDRDRRAGGGVPRQHHPALRARAQLPHLGEALDAPRRRSTGRRLAGRRVPGRRLAGRRLGGRGGRRRVPGRRGGRWGRPRRVGPGRFDHAHQSGARDAPGQPVLVRGPRCPDVAAGRGRRAGPSGPVPRHGSALASGDGIDENTETLGLVIGYWCMQLTVGTLRGGV